MLSGTNPGMLGETVMRRRVDNVGSGMGRLSDSAGVERSMHHTSQWLTSAEAIEAWYGMLNVVNRFYAAFI